MADVVDELQIEINAKATKANDVIDRLVVKIDRLTASLQSSKVSGASNKVVTGLNKTSASADKAKKSFSGLAYAFGKFYANFFLLIRGFKKLGNAIENSMNYVETYNLFK